MSRDSSTYLRSEVLQACREGDLEALASALSKGWSLAGETDRWSPLLEAVNARQVDACAFILGAGGSHTLSDSTGGTALHWASQKNIHLDPEDGGDRAAMIVKLLAKHGASFEATNKSGRTPLQIASVDDFLPTVQALLKAGCPPDYAPDKERPPLHLAASLGHTNICYALIDGGASLTLRSNGRRAEEWANFCGHRALSGELQAIRQALGAKHAMEAIARAHGPKKATS